MVITATILLLKCNAREHNWTAVSLWFLECSSLYRISIIGVFSHYYHLFNQNFTGWHDSGAASITGVATGVGAVIGVDGVVMVAWVARICCWRTVIASDCCAMN